MDNRDSLDNWNDWDDWATENMRMNGMPGTASKTRLNGMTGIFPTNI